MKSIVTKTGDMGETGVLNKRLPKDDALIELVGSIDELQSLIEDEQIAKDLYEIMGVLAGGKSIMNYELRITNLEKEIYEKESKLEPINGFLIFKNEKARRLNFARTVCRRAERRAVALRNYELRITNYELILKYLNRLSDYLFTLAVLEECGPSV